MDCFKINKRYQVLEKIGRGSVSTVFRVQDFNEVPLAAKLVSKRNSHLLENETKVMQKVTESREPGTPCWHYYGCYRNKHVLVMDLLGESLWILKHRLGCLSLDSALMIGIHMTARLEALHERGFIHCDVNPYNFLVGLGRDKNVVFLTNYGLSKKYREDDGSHKPNSTAIAFNTSKDFAPRHAHRGEMQSRRSDLESVLYTIIYLIRGLPWQHKRTNDLPGTAHMKENISAEELCKNLPVDILQYYNDVRDLGYDECPNYSSLHGHLHSALNRNGYCGDNIYDWNK